MQTTSQKQPPEETVTPLRGVLLYEDRDTHARALNLNAYLAIEVAKDIPIHFSWWGLATLSDPQSASIAGRAVTEADVLIIAANPTADWPLAFKLWIESWVLPLNKKLGAMGVLFSPPPANGHTICGRQAYLECIAARLKVDFLTAAPEPAALLKNKLGLVPTASLPAADNFSIVERPDYSPYCGING